MTVFQTKKKLEKERLNALTGQGNYVSLCEAGYRRRIRNLAQKILSSGCRIVLLAGPSSSGKTTSTHKLAACLREMGRGAQVVSLDNFYRNGDEYPKNPDGTDDYESIYALDIALVRRCLGELAEKGESSLPSFDFNTRRSTKDAISMTLAPGELLLVEGIHGLNPMLSEGIDASRLFRVYLSLRTEYYENGERVIPSRDLRIVRRMVRDVRERDRDAEGTLDMWPGILAGEEKWIRPFKKEADAVLNTSLDYEPCVFAPLLDEMHEKGLGGRRKEELDRLWAEFRGLRNIGTQALPEDSMLREFVGKS